MGLPYLAYEGEIQLPKPWMSSFKQEKGIPAAPEGCRSPASPGSYLPALRQHLGHQHFGTGTLAVVSVFLL